MSAKKKSSKVSKAKAREILADGSVHGHKLTAKQKRFFGAKANGSKKKK